MLASFDSFLKKVAGYNPRADLGLLVQIHADLFTIPVHENAPYALLSLGLYAADLLSSLHLDVPALAAALLLPACVAHILSLDSVRKRYGIPTGALIEGAVALSKMHYVPFGDRNARNFHLMLGQLAADYRCLFLYESWNISQFRQHSLDDSAIINRESELDSIERVLIPLAEEWGIAVFKRELQDLLFFWRNPEAYHHLSKEIAQKTQHSVELIHDFCTILTENFRAAGISAKVVSRTKTTASTWFKIQHRVGSLAEVYDLIAVRIIVDDESTCYAVISMLHRLWSYLPEKYKDYIASPKRNGYQSIHTTIFGSENQPFEIQVRTYQMHAQAERGIAAHWFYKKLIGKGISRPEKMIPFVPRPPKPSQIFVLTPRDEVIALPAGATGLDFAFHIHSELGYHAVGVRVNGSYSTLRRTLETGDKIEVITAAHAKPSEDWLSFTKTERARSKISHWLAGEREVQSAVEGNRWLLKQLKKLGITIRQLEKQNFLNELIVSLGVRDETMLMALIAANSKFADRVMQKIEAAYKKGELVAELPDERLRKQNRHAQMVPIAAKETKARPYTIIIDRKSDYFPRFSVCCNPKPGEEIFAFVTRGRGATIHSNRCPNASRLLAQPERILAAQWSSHLKEEKPLNKD